MRPTDIDEPSQACAGCRLTEAAEQGDNAALVLILACEGPALADNECNFAIESAIDKSNVEVFDVLFDAVIAWETLRPLALDRLFDRSLSCNVPHFSYRILRVWSQVDASIMCSLVRGADRPQYIELAHRAGVALDLVDESTGRTALHEASIYGHVEVVRALLDHGLDKGRRDRWGSTPLDLARRNHHERVVELLE